MTSAPARARPGRKAFWLKQLHTWHWISSAVSLVGLLLFAITGFTLNHAGDIEGSPRTVQKAATLPAPLLKSVAANDQPDTKKPLPPPVADWVRANFPTRAEGEAEWSADEVYLALPRPGGDGWIAIDRHSGAVTSEATDRGWISYLNDLHKGRHTGAIWSAFIDVFAVACLVFALTGLVLLWLHSRRRKATWPLVALGMTIPVALAAIFIHV